jgi:hypothetical protein
MPGMLLFLHYRGTYTTSTTLPMDCFWRQTSSDSRHANRGGAHATMCFPREGMRKGANELECAAGLTKVPIDGQPKSIVRELEDMARSYIKVRSSLGDASRLARLACACTRFYSDLWCDWSELVHHYTIGSEYMRCAYTRATMPLSWQSRLLMPIWQPQTPCIWRARWTPQGSAPLVSPSHFVHSPAAAGT